MLEAEVLLSQRVTLTAALKKIVISDGIYYRWCREYGSMRIELAGKLKNPERENTRLKKLVADLSLDNEILKGAPRGNFKACPGDARWSCTFTGQYVFWKDGHAAYLDRLEPSSAGSCCRRPTKIC